MNKIKLNKISPAYKFLFIMLTTYFVGFFINFQYFSSALVNTGKMLFNILPILILVIIVLWIINYFLAKGKIKKILYRARGVKGWLLTIIAGILIGGPPYVLYPMLSELKKQGMSDSLIAVFLFNRNVKIPFLPVSVFYFGLSFTVILSIYIILFSVINGLLVGKFADMGKVDQKAKN